MPKGAPALQASKGMQVSTNSPLFMQLLGNACSRHSCAPAALGYPSCDEALRPSICLLNHSSNMPNSSAAGRKEGSLQRSMSADAAQVGLTGRRVLHIPLGQAERASDECRLTPPAWALLTCSLCTDIRYSVLPLGQGVCHHLSHAIHAVGRLFFME